ncbi:MAG TPA: DUF6653 family protein [Mycobacterium sp.]
MSLEARLANVFGLKGEDAWRRHANPWSVYTRIPIPALLVAAIWSRTWIGWWSLLPIVVCLIWTVVNPRAFSPPRTLDSWASRSVMGETLWAERKLTPLPSRHRTAPVVLGALSAAGLPFLIWGLVVLDPWLTLFGLAIQMLGKLWFLDRMALLYDDVSSRAAPIPPRTDR